MQYIDGAYNEAAGTRDAFGGLAAQLVAEGHPDMVSIDGDREPDAQLAIWYDRMVLDPGDRMVYGTAWWNGVKWYRIHPDAVGVPGTSNHEKRRANDLAWPYNNTGTAAHQRAREISGGYEITCEGLNFGESWHWTFWGDLGTIGRPAGGGGSAPITPNLSEEDDMATLVTGGGQNLIVGGKLIPLNGPAEVQAVKGAQVLEVAPSTHYNIIQAFSRGDAASLPMLVYVRDGNGTVYWLSGGKLEPLVDPTTLAELHAKGAASVTLSQAEVDSLLKV